MQLVSDNNCYSLMLTNISNTNKTQTDTHCEPILPYPKEMVFPQVAQNYQELPKTFRLKTNYQEKLKKSVCHSVYSQYNTLAMNEMLSTGYTVKPKFMVAPMKTDIQFFKKESNIMFSMNNKEFDDIQNEASKLPSYFNWIDRDDNILQPFNQGLCGSCWAVAAATCLSDVFYVSKKVDKNPNLSTTYLLSCHPQGQCNGGDPSLAVNHMSNYGISSSDCLDYKWCSESACSGDPLKHFEADKDINQYIPSCSCLTKSENPKKYYADNAMAICIPPDLNDFNDEDLTQIKYFLGNLYGNVDKSGVDLSKKTYKQTQALIKHHIYTYGPVLGGFHVFKNFFKGEYRETNDIYVEHVTYKGVQGIDYNDVERDWVGSHAVSIIGWGRDNVHGEEVDYWIVRNSWGKSWGNRGIYKMAMYGDDPNKKYQNRISQFEYPSIVNLDHGIGITGGIILMKAGNIQSLDNRLLESESTNVETYVSPNPYQTHLETSNTNTFLSFLIFIAFLICLYFIFRQNTDVGMIIIEVFLLLLITGVLLRYSSN